VLHGPKASAAVVDADPPVPVLSGLVLGGTGPVPARRGGYLSAPSPPLRAPVDVCPSSALPGRRSSHAPVRLLHPLISRLGVRATSSLPCPPYARPHVPRLFVPRRWHYGTPMHYLLPSWALPSHGTWPWLQDQLHSAGTASGPKFISSHGCPSSTGPSEAESKSYRFPRPKIDVPQLEFVSCLQVYLNKPPPPQLLNQGSYLRRGSLALQLATALPTSWYKSRRQAHIDLASATPARVLIPTPPWPSTSRRGPTDLPVCALQSLPAFPLFSRPRWTHRTRTPAARTLTHVAPGHEPTAVSRRQKPSYTAYSWSTRPEASLTSDRLPRRVSRCRSTALAHISPPPFPRPRPRPFHPWPTTSLMTVGLTSRPERSPRRSSELFPLRTTRSRPSPQHW